MILAKHLQKWPNLEKKGGHYCLVSWFGCTSLIFHMRCKLLYIIIDFWIVSKLQCHLAEEQGLVVKGRV